MVGSTTRSLKNLRERWSLHLCSIFVLYYGGNIASIYNKLFNFITTKRLRCGTNEIWFLSAVLADYATLLFQFNPKKDVSCPPMTSPSLPDPYNASSKLFSKSALRWSGKPRLTNTAKCTRAAACCLGGSFLL